MATIRESRQSLRESGFTLTVVNGHDDIAGISEWWLEVERQSAEENMARAQKYSVAAWKRTLGRQYPVRTREGNTGRVIDPAVRRLRVERSAGGDRWPAPPGAPPGKVSGALQRSLKVGRRSWDKMRTVLSGRVFSTHPSAGGHEFGSPQQKIPSRPHWRPTLLREGENIGAIMAGEK